ncbi:MAG TPA: hypothetical protein VF599_04745 [Pyrinomonadaceae bacterium]|jgi:hypothetical protein
MANGRKKQAKKRQHSDRQPTGASEAILRAGTGMSPARPAISENPDAAAGDFLFERAAG